MTHQSAKTAKVTVRFLFIGLLVLVLGGTATAAQVLNDNTITNAVEDELLFDPAVPSYKMRVTCRDGIVTLTGTVDNLLAKNRAVDIVETVKGVRAVINKIHVSPLTEDTDEQIRENVRLTLAENPATELSEIWVEVSSGTVTLKGTVDSYLEKDLARILASGVGGVTEVTNNIVFSIKGSRPDWEILADLRQGMRWDALLVHERISVQVTDGKVTLTGVVGSAAEKQRAIDKSWLPGIREVNSDGLKVKDWARDPLLRKHKYKMVSDDEIRKALVRAIELDPRVDVRDVDVEVFDGVVVLKGDVDNLQACRSAAQDAHNTVGVFRVKNHLKVRLPQTNIRDSELEEKINQALERDAYLDFYEISVNVRHGVVRLYGEVQTPFEKVRAEDVASMIQGVFAVDNNILSRRMWLPFVYNPYVDENTFPENYGWYTDRKVAPVKSDLEITNSIKDELWWSPFVDEDQVKVTVDDGRATLEGEVDSRLEVNAAVENAFEGGAVSVDNDLTISGLVSESGNG